MAIVMISTNSQTRSLKSILNIGAGVLLVLLISAPSYATCSGTSMQVGDVLTTGDSIQVGDCALTMRADCDLVLSISGRFIWDSNTSGKGDDHCQLKLNSDGQLVIFSGAGATVWTSSFQGEDSNYVLEFTGEGNIVIRNLSDGHSEWSNCPTFSCIH